MDATTMPSLNSRIAKDYPLINFEPSDDFHWSPAEKTVFFKADEPNSSLLIHELSHALLGHDTYASDVALLKLEREAWNKALELSEHYDVSIDESTIESHLDTYRDWLHARSLCPTCKSNGYQVKKSLYRCLACSSEWKVNEARLCGLKRYTTKTPL